MGTLSRKQREIKEREALILDVATRMLVENGYLELSMDRIAEQIEYSKGTVYQHFSSKEDLVSAIVARTMETRADMFSRAAVYPGRARERMLGIGLASRLFIQLYPYHFKAEQVVRIDSIMGKAGENRRRRIEGCERRCIQIVCGIIRDAIEQGDLTLPDELTPEALTFSLWSMHFGGYALMDSDPLQELGIDDPPYALYRSIMALLDGLGFAPLTSAWDYEATQEKIRREVFASECSRLN